MKKNYDYLGRYFAKIAPALVEKMLNSCPKKILFDYRDITILGKIFSDYYGINFPGNLKEISARESTEMKIKFTAFVITCYDPESMDEHLRKRIQYKLRHHIAEFIHSNHSLVSSYFSKAKVYIRIYDDFKNDIACLVGMLKEC